MSDTRFLDHSALTALVFMVLWYGLGGYHALFVPINALMRAVPDPTLEVITYMGDALFALGVLLLLQRRPDIVWLGILAALLSTLASNGLKTLFEAVRPGGVLPAESFRLVGPLYTGRSFPSGHAITAFALAGTLGCFTGARLRAALLAAATVVAFSRVGVGAHWPVDVLGGAATGCACVRAAVWLQPYTAWGRSPTAQRIFEITLAGVAAWTLGETPVYPAAAWVAWPLAVAGIGLTTWNYLWKPFSTPPA